MPNIRLGTLLPKGLKSGSRSTKRAILEFTEQTGLVYFGFVSQREDEHHIVRGMTVSTKHHDDHYCIGTYEGYDVVFVERSDTLHSGKSHRWHIMEFDLKTNVDLPHAFLGSGKHGMGFHELLKMKYPSLLPTTLGVTATYPADFAAKFKAYVTPAHAVSLESIIDPVTAGTLGAHFGGLVVEITNDALYVYSERPHLTTELMLTMAKNGAWLASVIDTNSRSL